MIAWLDRFMIPPPRMRAVLPAKRHSLMLGSLDRLMTAPPRPSKLLGAELLLNVQRISSARLRSLAMPPPPVAELPLNVQSDSVTRTPGPLYIPPPVEKLWPGALFPENTHRLN